MAKTYRSIYLVVPATVVCRCVVETQQRTMSVADIRTSEAIQVSTVTVSTNNDTEDTGVSMSFQASEEAED